MKSDTVYKRTFNQMLDRIQDHAVGTALPSETVLAAELGASRTTIRKVLNELCGLGLLVFENRVRVVLSHDCAPAYHPSVETVSASERVRDARPDKPAVAGEPDRAPTGPVRSGDEVAVRPSSLPPGEMPERAFSAETAAVPTAVLVYRKGA